MSFQYISVLKAGSHSGSVQLQEYDAEEIKYCVELADVDVLVFGPEFIGRIEAVVDKIAEKRIPLLCGRQLSYICRGL